jgi:septal ring factor EnvC (AmiA/AmiB activator)
MRAAPRFLLAAAAAAALAAPFALPAEPSATDQIARARALLARADEALRGAREDETRLAALGQAVSAQEAALAALRAGLRGLARAERDATGRLDAQFEPLGRLLSALQSLARAPRSALLAVRGGPLEASRAAMLMAALAPELDRRAAALERDIAALRTLRRAQEEARGDAGAALAGLQELRAATTEALGRRNRAGLASRSDLRRQASAAAAHARDLGGLAAGLKAAGLDRPPGAAFADAKGTLPPPVAGRVAARFGAPDPWGRPGRGWSFEAADFAQVTAPWDATVRYAGPLIDYGQVVVLEPGPDYLVVLAGLGQTGREAGETVLAGERLGDMGGPPPTVEQFLLDAAAEDGQIRRKTLYVEIRRSGEPLDPANWFDPTASEAIR